MNALICSHSLSISLFFFFYSQKAHTVQRDAGWVWGRYMPGEWVRCCFNCILLFSIWTCCPHHQLTHRLLGLSHYLICLCLPAARITPTTMKVSRQGNMLTFSFWSIICDLNMACNSCIWFLYCVLTSVIISNHLVFAPLDWQLDVSDQIRQIRLEWVTGECLLSMRAKASTGNMIRLRVAVLGLRLLLRTRPSHP